VIITVFTHSYEQNRYGNRPEYNIPKIEIPPYKYEIPSIKIEKPKIDTLLLQMEEVEQQLKKFPVMEIDSFLINSMQHFLQTIKQTGISSASDSILADRLTKKLDSLYNAKKIKDKETIQR
jgi:hypothetical protein